MTKRMRAKYRGRCKACSRAISRGESIVWEGRGRTYHAECYGAPAAASDSGDPEDHESIMARRDEAEYQAGKADADRYLAERKVYGPELAERFAMEDEFNRYWKYGEDY